MLRSAAQIAEAIEQRIQQEVAASFKKLLEQKHLYQSLDVEVDAVIEELAKIQIKESGRIEPNLIIRGSSFFAKPWIVTDPTGRFSYPPGTGICIFNLSHIKTFCERCERIEPFNPFAAVDFLDQPRDSTHYSLSTGVVQNFVLSFLCQGCKLIPEVFIVRRVGKKLSICGRSPIEHVEVARYIPQAAKQYVSGAIVAHQSGQTLAGLFLLRTSIEQWIRSLGAKHEKADQAIDWYMTTLPPDFKSQFPSLRDVYGLLSDAVHAANASATLFDKTKADIEEHFDARRLYKLTEPKAL